MPGSRWKRKAFLFREAFREFNKDNAPQFAAALAFYAILSLAPLLLLTVGIAGLIFGADAARGEIVGRVEQFVGREAALAIQKLIANAAEDRGGAFAGVIGFLALIWSASKIFRQLKIALNQILNVPEQKEGGVVKIILDRLLSLGMVLAMGVLLLVSILLNTVLSRMGTLVSDPIPGGAMLWSGVSFLVFFLFVTAIIALAFRYVPDVELGWREVMLGAAFTALLFGVGQLLIGWYLGRGDVGSSFGAAGSFILILVWIYFTTSIFFFGAESMEVWARENPRFVEDRERRQRETVHPPRASSSSPSETPDPEIG